MSGAQVAPAIPGAYQAEPRSEARISKDPPMPVHGKDQRGCPGYVVDHVVPLKRGGADAPSNMQWLDKAGAEAKDKIE
jgi:hypothetical protein